MELFFDQAKYEENKIIVSAGSTGVWKLVFKLNGKPVSKGGSVLFRRERATAFGCSMQIADKSQSDFLQLQSNSKAQLRLSTEICHLPTRKWQEWLPNKAEGIRVTVMTGTLEPGDEIVLTIGQNKAGLKSSVINLRSQHGADELSDFHLECLIDNNGSGDYHQGAETFLCIVEANSPARIIAAADSVANENGSFDIIARVEDVYSNLCCDYHGELSIFCSNISGLPEKVAVSDGRIKLQGKLISDKAGTVEFEDVQNGIKGKSNPILPADNYTGGKVYWGELHSHTNLSWDGRGDIDEAYDFAANRCKLDFTAITDHTITKKTGEDLDEEESAWWNGYWWNEHKRAAKKYYTPGKFVPLLAQECHPGDRGDHNTYYPSYDSELIIPKYDMENHDMAAEHYNKYYEEVNNANAFAIAHVGGGPKKTWDYHDEKAEPLLEIASCHGCFELFAQQALQRGYRMGFVYGSDFHCGTPGSGGHVTSAGKLKLPLKKSGLHNNGFTALLTDKLELENVLATLRAGRCYSVTGQQRPVIDFRINGRQMGAELETEASPKVQIKIDSSVKLRSIKLIRNDKIAFDFQDDSGNIDIRVTDDNIRSGMNYYYLRVTFENDDLAWSSPIWVNFTGTEASMHEIEANWDKEEVENLNNIPFNEASEYEKDFIAYMDKLMPGRFHGIKGVRVVNNSYGRYALFFGFDSNKNDAHTSFRYMLDFEAPCIIAGYNWCLFNTMDLNFIK